MSGISIDSQLYERLIVGVAGAARQLCAGSHSSAELKDWIASSISFPNKNDDIDGKPHNVEIRIALSLFHKTRKRKRGESSIELVSDLGLVRLVRSPVEVADLFCQLLNQEWDVRVDESGIMCLVTEERSKALRQSGKLPCPRCIKWCKGEKGLWWHQQLKHGIKHNDATEHAASEQTTLALIPYNPAPQIEASVGKYCSARSVGESEDDVFVFARQGNLEAIQSLMLAGTVISDTWDKKGASPLHWAAGSGQRHVVEFLVTTCNCDPNVGQRGKRSFSGRTALHWAARNGHLAVVRYLVEDCKVDLDATTIDGTTAFNWACWQGHLDVMKYLHGSCCDVHKINSFGCNAVLWCAQGEGNRLESMKWLRSIGCHMSLTNSNGHGALHKAAQRGRGDLVDWLMEEVEKVTLEWIGPDSEGCCPSDLAGMEGHVDLAMSLVEHEAALVRVLHDVDNATIPGWLTSSNDESKYASNVWEPWGGTRRMRKTVRQMIKR